MNETFPEISFDDMLLENGYGYDQEHDSDFGTLRPDMITVGVAGLLSPGIAIGALAPGECSFAMSQAELQRVVAILELMLKGIPARHRLCRLTVLPERIQWEVDKAFACVQVTVHGELLAQSDYVYSSSYIIALDDLLAASFATTERADFKVGPRNTIEFSSEAFRRPLLVYPSEQFMAHSEKMRRAMTSKYSGAVETAKICSALRFLARFIDKDEVDDQFGVVMIHENRAIAGSRGVVAKVEGSILENLNLSVRSRLLPLLIDIFPFIGEAHLQQGDDYCTVTGRDVSFGFELSHVPFPPLKWPSVADGFLLSAKRLRTGLGAALDMFGGEASLRLSSQAIEIGTFKMVASAKGSKRRFSFEESFSRSSNEIGAFSVSMPCKPLHTGLLDVTNQNASLGFTKDLRHAMLDLEVDDMTFVVLMSTEQSK